MKKTILSSLILGAVFATSSLYAGVPTTTVMPQPAPVAASSFDGFYVGASVDVVSPLEKVTNEYDLLVEEVVPGMQSSLTQGITIFEMTQEVKSKDSGTHNVGGSLFAGYGKTFDSQTYLGLEVFGHYYAAKARLQDDFTVSLPGDDSDGQLTTDTYIKNPYSYGLAIRGGYLITPQTMFYVLFGAELSRFEVKNVVNFDLTDSTDEASVSITNKFNKNRVGYTPAVGLETFMNQNCSIRAQYAYTFYDSFKHTVNTTDIDESSMPPTSISQTSTTTINPSRGMFSLMLSYYFG